MYREACPNYILGHSGSAAHVDRTGFQQARQVQGLPAHSGKERGHSRGL